MAMATMTDASSPTPAISARHAVVAYGERRALDGVSLAMAVLLALDMLASNSSRGRRQAAFL